MLSLHRFLRSIAPSRVCAAPPSVSFFGRPRAQFCLILESSPIFRSPRIYLPSTMSSTLTQTKQASPAVASGKQTDAAAQQPPFTLTTLRESIPKHCFEKNLWVSIYYMLRDFAFIGVCYAVYPYINAAGGIYNPYGLTKFLWWNVVGFFGWCLFVVGHDCGQWEEHRESKERGAAAARNSVRTPLCATFVAHRPAAGRCARVSRGAMRGALIVIVFVW